MNEPPITGSGPRSVHPALRLDAACDRFEAAWRTGRRPRIEDCLNEVAESERTGLLRELLEVELELRRGDGETPGHDGPAAGSSRFRDPAAARQRRAGRGLRGLRRGAAPRGGPQADPGPARRRRRQPRRGSCSRPRSPAGWSTRGSCRSTAWAHYADGRPFYAMRFIRGDSLKEAIERFHAADESRAAIPASGRWRCASLLGRFVDVCNAIAYAHSRGVLHRDLKPGNIMLGKYGETLVVDWGLAKPRRPARGRRRRRRRRTLRPVLGQRRDAETLPGSALGTPAYMSPEQAAGELDQLGPASDVYSLGATLYCLLTGRPPFEERRHRARCCARCRAGEIPAAAAGRPRDGPARPGGDLPEGDGAAARGPLRLGRALADDVEHWLADEPVTAWREPWLRRARRWAAAPHGGGRGGGGPGGRGDRSGGRGGRAGPGQPTAPAGQRGHEARAGRTRASKKVTEEALAQTKAEGRDPDGAGAVGGVAEQAEAVSNFLVEAFRSPDPSQDGRQVESGRRPGPGQRRGSTRNSPARRRPRGRY